jgi:hypothetical protein
MFGEDQNDSIVQRGLDEALACQDLLERTPTKPSVFTRAILRVGLVIRSVVHRGPDGETTRDPNDTSLHMRTWKEQSVLPVPPAGEVRRSRP